MSYVLKEVKIQDKSGCGCFSLIFGILTVWALWFGLPTPWGTFNIDIFPPQIRQTSTTIAQ